MNKTKIEWCDSTWNPVTGCLHDCPYCYARGIAKRFGNSQYDDGKIHTRDDLYKLDYAEFHKLAVSPYPFGFSPTLHRNERFGWHSKDPSKIKKPQKIFVCSMADLFGEWVPDEWIKAIFEATNKAPQHSYIYLTKNPDRYYQLGDGDGAIIPDNGVSGWFGASACTEKQAQAAYKNLNCSWMSLEPLHEGFSEDFFTHTALVGDGMFDEIRRWDWIVVGAETGNRKDKKIPKREWIENIVAQCQETGTPVFMKNSLADIWGEPLIQQWPESMKGVNQ